MLVFYYGPWIETKAPSKGNPHLQYIIQTVYDVQLFSFTNYRCNDVFIIYWPKYSLNLLY